MSTVPAVSVRSPGLPATTVRSSGLPVASVRSAGLPVTVVRSSGLPAMGVVGRLISVGVGGDVGFIRVAERLLEGILAETGDQLVTESGLRLVADQ